MVWHTMFWRLYKGPSSLPPSPIRPLRNRRVRLFRSPWSCCGCPATVLSGLGGDCQRSSLVATTSNCLQSDVLLLRHESGCYNRDVTYRGSKSSSESLSDSAGEREAIGLEKEVAISLPQPDAMEMGHAGKSQSNSKLPPVLLPP
jgi:hypothetical protein